MYNRLMLNNTPLPTNSDPDVIFTYDGVNAPNDAMKQRMTHLIIADGVIHIGAKSFELCGKLKSIGGSTNTIKSIGDRAFMSCILLESIEFLYTETIGYAAFAECTSLVSADLLRANSLGGMAFARCTSLTSINAPSVTLVVQGDTFFGTKINMNNINNSSTITYYGDTYIPSTMREKITHVIIADGVTQLRENAFYACRSLTRISGSTDTIKSISEKAFGECISLKSIKFPNVETVGISAFTYCSSLVSFDLPNVETIEDDAFTDCSSLVSVNMPNAKILGDRAFFFCNSLKTIKLPNAETLGERAFFNCNSMETINLPSMNTLGDSAFLGCTSLVSIDIPSVTIIFANTFGGCNKLSQINVPWYAIRLDKYGKLLFCF